MQLLNITENSHWMFPSNNILYKHLILKGLLLLSVLKITPPSLQRSSTCCENVGASLLCQSCATVIDMGK